MAERVYWLPVEMRAMSAPWLSRCPKYLPRWSQLTDFGLEPIAMAFADLTPAEHAVVVANADVLAAPADRTRPVGAALITIQAVFEGWRIPADWITATMTIDQVVKGFGNICQLGQRFVGLHHRRIFDASDALDTRFVDLPAARAAQLAHAAEACGLKTDRLAGPVSFRTVLRAVAGLGHRVRPAVRAGR